MWVHLNRYDLECEMRGCQKWKADIPGPVRRLSTINNECVPLSLTNDSRFNKWSAFRANDESE